MSCDSCGHTMQPLDASVWFWCPRCGSIRMQGGMHPEAPKLVERCREFRAARHPSFKAEVGIFGDPVLAAEWVRLGIAEAINVSGDRPQ